MGKNLVMLLVLDFGVVGIGETVAFQTLLGHLAALEGGGNPASGAGVVRAMAEAAIVIIPATRTRMGILRKDKSSGTLMRAGKRAGIDRCHRTVRAAKMEPAENA